MNSTRDRQSASRPYLETLARKSPFPEFYARELCTISVRDFYIEALPKAATTLCFYWSPCEIALEMIIKFPHWFNPAIYWQFFLNFKRSSYINNKLRPSSSFPFILELWSRISSSIESDLIACTKRASARYSWLEKTISLQGSALSKHLLHRGFVGFSDCCPRSWLVGLAAIMIADNAIAWCLSLKFVFSNLLRLERSPGDHRLSCCNKLSDWQLRNRNIRKLFRRFPTDSESFPLDWSLEVSRSGLQMTSNSNFNSVNLALTRF